MSFWPAPSVRVVVVFPVLSSSESYSCEVTIIEIELGSLRARLVAWCVSLFLGPWKGKTIMEEEEEARRAVLLRQEQQEEMSTGMMKKKRGRVVLRRIEDRTSRQVRFSKRRSGMFKKAHELSVLCDAQVALVVFSPAGRLYSFASAGSSIDEIFGRYWDLADTLTDLNIEARDSRVDCNIQKERPSVGSLTDQLNIIAQWAMEANANEMSVAEIRSLEETVTDALTVIRNKLRMKVVGLPQT